MTKLELAFAVLFVVFVLGTAAGAFRIGQLSIPPCRVNPSWATSLDEPAAYPMCPPEHACMAKRIWKFYDIETGQELAPDVPEPVEQ